MFLLENLRLDIIIKIFVEKYLELSKRNCQQKVSEENPRKLFAMADSRLWK